MFYKTRKELQLVRANRYGYNDCAFDGKAHDISIWPQLLHPCYTNKVRSFITGVRHCTGQCIWTVHHFFQTNAFICLEDYVMIVSKTFTLKIPYKLLQLKFSSYSHYSRQSRTKWAYRKAQYASERRCYQSGWINLYYITHSNCAFLPANFNSLVLSSRSQPHKNISDGKPCIINHRIS